MVEQAESVEKNYKRAGPSSHTKTEEFSVSLEEDERSFDFEVTRTVNKDAPTTTRIAKIRRKKKFLTPYKRNSTSTAPTTPHASTTISVPAAPQPQSQPTPLMAINIPPPPLMKIHLNYHNKAQTGLPRPPPRDCYRGFNANLL